MVKERIGDIALLPIKPQFVEAILNGDKWVEFRKQKFKRNVTHIVIYSSKPVQRIVGYFDVNRIREAKPHSLWCRYSGQAGINRKRYLEYYNGAKKGVAIEIGEKNILNTPIGLSDLSADLIAPQNYKYLNKNLFYKIRTLPHRTIS